MKRSPHPLAIVACLGFLRLWSVWADETRIGLTARSPETAVQYFFDAVGTGSTNDLLWVLTPEYGNQFQQPHTMAFVLAAWREYKLVEIEQVSLGERRSRIGVKLQRHGEDLRGELGLSKIGESWYVREFTPHSIQEPKGVVPQPPNDVEVARAEIDGRWYVFTVNRKRYKSSGWDPKSGEPPVSVSKAITLASHELDRLTATPKAWQVFAVSLSKVYPLDDWVYVVSFGGISAAHPGQATIATVPVLLSGTVVAGM